MSDIRVKTDFGWKDAKGDNEGKLLLGDQNGNWKIATIADEGTVSSAVDLGGHYPYMLIQIPTIDSANISVQVAEEQGGTYDDLGLSTNVIAAATGSFHTTIKIGGWRYIKIKSSATQSTGAVSFRVCGVRV